MSYNFDPSTITDALRQPITPDLPVGEDPRLSIDGATLYRRLRDARSVARNEERRRQQSDDPGERLRLCPEWNDVRLIAEEILALHAKDIEVLVWLTEAQTRLAGFGGAAACLELMLTLVRDHGVALHSLEEDHPAERFAPIGALSGVGGEGTLIQPVRLLPLLPGAAYGECSLWELQSGARAAETAAAIRAADLAALTRHLAEIEACIAKLSDLDATLTEMFGTDAPPTARLAGVLGEAARAVRLAAGLTEAAVGPVERSEAADASTPPDSVATPAPCSREIVTREDAFRQMLEIAAFFRRTEPHSPVSAALETLVRRGRMDFLSLLAELVPDESARRAVMTKAGIEVVPGEG